MSIDSDSNRSREDTDSETVFETETALLRHKTGEALSKAGFGDVLVLSHDAADRVLTPTRRAIIEALAEYEVGSMRELGEILDRDPGNLSRDLKVLVAEDILRYKSDGKAKKPELKHETIIQEPVVASDGPLPSD